MSHCNDSKIEFGGKKDRHEHIGEGKIGIEGFKNLFANKKLATVNFIAETEHDKIVEDLKLLKSLR
jgi:deoxyribonuclease-4